MAKLFNHLFRLVLISAISWHCAVYAKELSIERLTWAGVKLVSGNTTVLIDAVGTDLWDGNAPEGLVKVSVDTPRKFALITHAHNDHFDAATLKEVLGDNGYIICHEDIATYIASRGFKVIPAKTYQPVFRGDFSFTPVPAEDGFGGEQVSWVVSVANKKLLHAGDTLWHGKWRTIGRQFGPFDVAFMPINGAKVGHQPKSDIPAVMTPEQAVDAAVLMSVKNLVPIHYGLMDPPHYVEVDQPVATTLKLAKQRGIKVTHLKPGEQLK